MKLKVAVWPAVMVWLADEPAAIPMPPMVPFKATECGLPEALSAICSVAVSSPEPLGVYVTEMWQEDEDDTMALQSWVSEKSLAEVPTMLMLLNTRSALPLLLKVTVCAMPVAPATGDMRFNWA